MAEAPSELHLGVTWENQLVLHLPRSVFLATLIISAALTLAYVAFQWTFGFPIERVPILTTVIIAYTMSVTGYLNRAISLDRVRYGLEEPAANRRESELRVTHLPRDAIRRSRLAGGVGVLFGIAIIEAVVLLRGDDPVAALSHLHTGTAGVPLILLAGWLLGRAGYLSIGLPIEMPTLRLADVDLLNLENLHGFGRSGLRVSLVWLVGISIFGLFFLDLGVWILLPIIVVGFLLGAVALLRPVRGVQRMIAEVKRAELARLAPQIRAARDEAVSGGGSSQGRLADLLSYEARIAATSEWPFDSSTLWRFGLYLSIPVVSMIGGALVERAVDLLLD